MWLVDFCINYCVHVLVFINESQNIHWDFASWMFIFVLICT